MSDRIITFKYAKDNLDAFKKQFIPNSLKTMRKSEVDAYINADMMVLGEYENNQLVPQIKVIGKMTNPEDFCYHFNDIVHVIRVQSDGKILVGGAFTTYKGITCNRIVRLHPTGEIDTTFITGIGFDSLGPTSETYTASVYTIAQDPDGKIMVGGTFDRYNGVTTIGIIRLNSNGTKDTTFNSTVFHSGIYSEPCFSIIRDGSYYYVSGDSTPSIAKLNMSGGLVTTTNLPPHQITVKVGSNLYATQRNLRISVVNADTMGVTQEHGDFGTAQYWPILNGIIHHNSTNSLIIYGSFEAYKGIPVRNIAKISLSGVLDTNFAANTNALFSSQNNTMISTIGQDTVGNLYVGTMGFGTYSGDIKVFKLTSSGSHIPSFNFTAPLPTGHNFNSQSVQTIFHSNGQSTGELYIGGRLLKANTTEVRNMVKVSPTTGSVIDCDNSGNPDYVNLSISLNKATSIGQLSVTINGNTTIYNDPIYIGIPVPLGAQLSAKVTAAGSGGVGLIRSLLITLGNHGSLYNQSGTFDLSSDTYTVTNSISIMANIDNQ